MAVSDLLGITAQPIGMIQTHKQDVFSEIKNTIQTYEIHKVIVGLPLNMNGSEGPLAEASRQFGNEISDQSGLPVVFWDERLSSREIERAMISGGVRRNKRKTQKDTLSAVLILQSYLDYLSTISQDSNS